MAHQPVNNTRHTFYSVKQAPKIPVKVKSMLCVTICYTLLQVETA